MSSAYLATYMDPALVRFMDSSRGRGRVWWASDHPVIPAQKALDAAQRAAAVRRGHGAVPRRRRPRGAHRSSAGVTAMDPAGEHLAAFAASTPDKAAVVMHPSGVVRTYREIDDASIRLARVLRERGLGPGDHVAVLLDNQPEFYDVVWAAQRIGCFVTPINWHLTADEAGYIVSDCDATALFATARLATSSPQMGDDLAAVTTRVCVDGDLPGLRALRRPGRRRGGGRARRPARGRLDVLQLGHHRQAEGDPAAAARRRPRRQVVPHHAARRPVRLHQRRRVPVPRAAVPRRAGGLDDRRAAARRHRRRDGALRPARAAGRHRAPPHHPRAARADPHDPAAQAHRRGALALRPVEPPDGRSTRRRRARSR